MRRLAFVVFVIALLAALSVDARIGGGDSYSGSSSSSSSSSSSYSGSSSSDHGSSSSGSSGGVGEVSGFSLFALFVLFVFLGGMSALVNGKQTTSIFTVTTAQAGPAPVTMGSLRHHDPNFSEIVFTDFCYSLFARLYEARGNGRLDDLAPYVASAVRAGLKQTAPAGLRGVDAIVVGAFTIVWFRGIDTPRVEADVEFEANYTEAAGAGVRRWYVREVWTLTRMRDVLSPRPENAKAEHCPKCGSGLEMRPDGACAHCGTKIEDGTFHWYVTSIRGLSKEERPPQLGGPGGPEPGLDRPTAIQAWIGKHCQTFVERHPGFSWDGFYQRVAQVAVELQNAWSSRDWRRARPLETDALFQTHRYWIEEYLRQGLRNVVDHYRVDRIEIAKVTSDAFFDAITVRLFASGNDYTVDEAGTVVGGMPGYRKAWSEYWTLVRGRAGGTADARVCPNCGGSLAAGQAVVCEYCGGKITTGEFPWVLSRIEQDEAYRG